MQILELSQPQIEAIIFKGADPEESRTLLDQLTEEEICILPRHPDWETFDLEFRNWVWETIYGILSSP